MIMIGVINGIYWMIQLIVIVSAKTIFERNSVLSIQINRIDLHSLGTHQLNVSVNSYYTNSMILCGHLKIPPEDIRRCTTGVSRSMRLLRRQSVAELVEVALESENLSEFPIDGVNWRVSYAYGYDSIPPKQNEKTTNICIIGQVQLQLLFSLALLHPKSSISVIIDETSVYDYRIIDIFNDIAGFNDERSAKLFSFDPLETDSKPQHFPECDVIHIKSFDIHSKQQVYQVLSHLTEERSVEDSPVSVIWERRVPAECKTCLKGAENCVDPNTGKYYSRLGNTSISRFCYDQYHFRNALLWGRSRRDECLSTSSSFGSPSFTALQDRLIWEYSGHSDLFVQYLSKRYGNGMLGLTMNFDKDHPVDVFCGLLYPALTPTPALHNPSVAIDQSSTTCLSSEEASPDSDLNNDIDQATLVSVNVRPTYLTPPGTTTTPLDKNELVIFITYANRVFDDTAFGIADALDRLGYSSVCVMGDWDATMLRMLRAGIPHEKCAVFNTPDYMDMFSTVHYQRYSQDQGESLMPSRYLLQIAVGPHEPSVFAPYYIAFQMEQPWSIFFSTSDYLRTFSDALAVWCFTHHHRDYLLQRLSLPEERVQVVPIFTRTLSLPSIPTIQSKEYRERAEQAGWALQELDFIVTGSHSERRAEIGNQLHAWSQQNSLISEIIFGKWTQLPFGEERHLSLALTKVVLNIHADERSSLEVHRINHLLSLSKCIISERSVVDSHTDSLYAGAVIFADNTTHLHHLAGYYIQNETARLEVEKSAYQMFKLIQENTTMMARSMEYVHHQLRSIMHKTRVYVNTIVM